MPIQTNASTFGALQVVTCFAIAHALRHSATRLLECSVLCPACHETAEHDSWVRDAARVEVVRKEVLWLSEKSDSGEGASRVTTSDHSPLAMPGHVLASCSAMTLTALPRLTEHNIDPPSSFRASKISQGHAVISEVQIL